MDLIQLLLRSTHRVADELLRKAKQGSKDNFFRVSSKNNYSVGQLIDEIKKSWDKANWRDISENEEQLYEAGLLKLNCDKALFDLDWQPTLNFQETVKMTADWYKHYTQIGDSSMYDFSILQIQNYVQIAQFKSIAWSKDD